MTSATKAMACSDLDTMGDGDTTTRVGCGNCRCGSVSLQLNDP